VPHELPDQEELKELASPFFHFELRGGEGHMLVGKACMPISQTSQYDVRAVSLFLHAEHDVPGRHGERAWKASQPALAPIEIKEMPKCTRCPAAR